MNCYDCGIPLTLETKTAEHIPAKNLFATYPASFKQNLITVPACLTCNNRFSKVDQEIRDAIGIMNENKTEQLELTKKAVRSIFRNGNWTERVSDIDNPNKFSVSFNYFDLEKLHIKNLKGLFYHKYGKPIGDNFEFKAISEGDEKDEKLQRIKSEFSNYINQDTSWEIIGHENIFRYKLKALIPNEFGQLSGNGVLNDSNGFVCLMEYHKILKPLVIVTKKTLINRD